MENTKENLSTTPTPVIRNTKTPKLLAVAVIVLILLAATVVSVVIHRNHNSQKPATVQPAANAYSVVGPVVGSGLSFSAPAGFQQLSKTDDQLILQKILNTGNTGSFTFVAALSQLTSPSLSTADLSNTAASLNSPTSASYKDAISGAEQFVNDRVTSVWKTQINPARKFTNPNIKSNAWNLDFTATNQGDKLQGTAVYALTANSSYYFMVSSDDSTWKANSGEWQNILDSLKIKQSPGSSSTLRPAGSNAADLPLPTCYDTLYNSFVHYGDCTSLEVKYQAYHTADGCYDAARNFLHAGVCR